MTEKQPEALLLADVLEGDNSFFDNRAAAELRRLHEVNQMLLKALNKMRDAYIGTCVEVQADAMKFARAAITKAEGMQS